jgi:uncharacterized protein YndB with AHSA1/START domain/DNA-binding transcriptional ArsR family regulator
VDADAVFRALADPSRRLLLDRLAERDGQSIRELGAGLSLGRFGVAKHLGVLERAGLVSSRRVDRRRLHYLNPVPIHDIYERWVSKYAAPWAAFMSRLKTGLETGARPHHVYNVFIRASQQEIWDAITQAGHTRRYYYGMRVASSWRPGARYAYRDADGGVAIEGRIVEIEPPRRLVQTFRFASRDEAPSRVTWEIEPMGDVCRLTLVHEFDAMGGTYESVDDPMGWQFILSSLKSLLETSEGLEVGA